MRIVFWQNTLSFHQSAHISALAALPGCEVTWVVQETVRPERAALGWPVPDPGGARSIVAPSHAEVRALALSRPDESVHIFSGLRSYPTVAKGLEACLPTATTIGLLAEAQDGRGWRGILRLLRARCDWRTVHRRVGFVLAIGERAPEWYARCGCPLERIYPYGYFVERPLMISGGEATTARVRILFVGQFIPRKGGDVLLDALSSVSRAQWSCEMVGAGPREAAWRRLAKHGGISDRVRFIPPLPSSECMARLSRADVLVLPSRFDGWGAVVSEALMRGVPVVCTDQCGASALLTEPWRGEVVKAGSAFALRDALERWVAKGRRTSRERQRIVDWSACITGGSAASYLLAVIGHAQGRAPRPEPPWLRRAHSSAME